MVKIETKRCKECGETKPVTGFGKGGSRLDGSVRYRATCKDCWNRNRRSVPTKIATAGSSSGQHFLFRPSSDPRILKLQKCAIRGANIDCAGLWERLLDAVAAKRRAA